MRSQRQQETVRRTLRALERADEASRRTGDRGAVALHLRAAGLHRRAFAQYELVRDFARKRGAATAIATARHRLPTSARD